MATEAKTLYREDLPECADCIESHPNIGNLFALATYQVDQEEVDQEMGVVKDDDDDDDEEVENTSSSPPYTRTGMVRLYTSQESQDSIACDVVWEKKMSAVLDMKWSLLQSSQRGMLGVADSTGQIGMYHLSDDAYSLEHVKTFKMNDKKALCLSLDFSNRLQSAQDASMIVSQSDGTLAFLPSVQGAVHADEELLKQANERLRDGYEASDDDDDDSDSGDGDNDGQEQQEQDQNRPLGLHTWQAHEHEAWITAFDPHSHGRVVWSGGDDLALKGWDTRTSCSSSTFTNRRSFDGGVTSMECHHSRPHLWAVGSYDSNVRLFDSRNPIRPIETVEVSGGVWRLKWNPNQSNKLLAACMHGGFDVLDVQEGKQTSVVKTFKGHTSLAYGSDWDRGKKDQSDTATTTSIYSCSFYDKRLCAWAA
ncbi:unnamed protein product [Sympodiomycopsis kandeliae]